MRWGDKVVAMKMLKRLRYLLAEGFEVGNIACYDAPAGSNELARGSLIYVRLGEKGVRRLVSEDFEVTAKEAKRCSRLFMTSKTR
jgi:hypothetical protein